MGLGLIDLADQATRGPLERSLQAVLGDGCGLEVAVDHDAWPFCGNCIEFEAAITELVRDAGREMCSPDVLRISVLNVYDRYGGSKDQVLVALSYLGRGVRTPPGELSEEQEAWVRGNGIVQARRFAERVGADCLAVCHPATGTTVSLLLPKSDPKFA